MKTVKIAAKTATRLVWRLIVIVQSPVEGGITKLFSYVLLDLESFKNRYICYFRDILYP